MKNSDAPRDDWPFGPFLTAAITKSGMSKRAIARASKISEGRIRQLETGYQKSGGMHIPISTTATTVHSLSNVLGFDAWEGLRLSGLESAIPDQETIDSLTASALADPEHQRNPDLARFTFGDLTDEIMARYEEAVFSPPETQWVTSGHEPRAPKGTALVATTPEIDARSRRRHARQQPPESGVRSTREAQHDDPDGGSLRQE